MIKKIYTVVYIEVMNYQKLGDRVLLPKYIY